MKRLLLIGFLTTSLAGQAFSMGHPHNVFAARKRMHAKLPANKLSTKDVKTQAVKPTYASTLIEKGAALLTKGCVRAVTGVLPNPY
jgi:hypothetical protein